MRRPYRVLPIFLTVFFLAGMALSGRAKGEVSLTAAFSEGEWFSRARFTIYLTEESSWRLVLTGSIPQKIKSGEEAWFDLAITYPEDRWRLDGRYRLMTTTAGTEGFWQWRGTYRHPHGEIALTLGELDPADPARETGGAFRLTRRWGRAWRLTLTGSQAAVTTNVKDEHRTAYTATAGLDWYRPTWHLQLVGGGRSVRGEEPADDWRNLYGELRGEFRLGGGWYLLSLLRLNRHEEPFSVAEVTSFHLDLRRRAPVGLRFQAGWKDITASSMRVGFAVTGTHARWGWSLGVAADLDPAGGSGAAWGYGDLTWEDAGRGWRVAVTAAPQGEYAPNTRHGYSFMVERRF